jgi:hyperosmotically inducible periplasmic protein
MIDTLPKVRVAVLLAAVALVAGCDSHRDPHIAGKWRDASAGMLAQGSEGAVGTDQSVEDSTLTAKVREAILADAQLQSQQIVVESEDSAVILTGTVDSQSLRERAVGLAGSVDGVAQVQDKLEVRI